jgi:hypothetical protein
VEDDEDCELMPPSAGFPVETGAMLLMLVVASAEGVTVPLLLPLSVLVALPSHGFSLLPQAAAIFSPV